MLQSPTGEGTLSFQNEELVCVLISKKDGDTVKYYGFTPGRSGMTILDSVSSTFDNYRVLSAEYHYRPAVGSNRDGIIVAGLDFSTAMNRISTTLGEVQAYSPRMRSAVWQTGKLVVPKTKLSNRATQYTCLKTSQPTEDNTPFGLHVGISSSDPPVTFGDIWCRYRVVFSGPRPSPI